MSSANYDDVGAALRSDRLYVDPTARDELVANETPFDTDAENAVRDQLKDASTDIYIAVLPEASMERTAIDDIRRTAGQSGTYLVLFSRVPDEPDEPEVEYITASDEFTPAAVRSEADAAFEGARGPEGFFLGFINGVEDLAAEASGDVPAGSGGASDPGGSGYVPLAVLLAGAGGGLLLYRRNKRRRELADLTQVRVVLDEDITAYGEELTSLDLDVRSDDVPAEAQEEYARALDRYEEAKSAADRAERPGHLRPVTSALEEGRWLLACAKARIEGAAVPERRPPCFFDPRHGPSVEDVTWAPGEGAPREVPACQADVVRLRDGQVPDARMVTVHGDRRPYWEAGPAYAPWAGGYFGGFLPGMLWGTMLGSTFAHGSAYGDAGGHDGGGDFGGGDFGGGDFGGGDFGGGDFGGGDFGGF